ncbi:hypothetical protein ABEW50_20330 [Paenibacillus jamilae]
MKDKIFWVIYQKRKAMFHRIKSLWFYVVRRNDKRRELKTFWATVIKLLIRQIILNLFFVSILLISDQALRIYCVKVSIDLDKDLISNFIVAGISVAGIFLGLYCSNLSSIYVGKYANAPESIANLFENDVLTNKGINHISSYIVFSLIFVLANLVQLDIGLISLCTFVIFSIWIIISFGLIGNRRHRLSDTYGIADQVHMDIDKIIKKVIAKDIFSNDINFQNHYQKLCAKKLNVLSDIANYNIGDPANRSEAMIRFMIKNNTLLSTYLHHKKEISFSSYWYREKFEYQKWFLADDHDISIALSTGTALQPKRVKDYYWFEDTIIAVNAPLFNKLINSNDYNGLQSFCSSLAHIANFAVESNAVNYFLDYIDAIQKRIMDMSLKDESFSNEGDNLASLVDALMTVYVAIVVGINNYLENIKWSELLSYALDVKEYERLDLSKNKFLNNRRSEKMYHGIYTELQIEKKRITADWFVEQTLAHNIYELLEDISRSLDKIYNEIVFNLGKTFFERKAYFCSMLVFSRMSELKSKMNISMAYLKEYYQLLESKHFEPTIIWPESSLPTLEERQYKTFKELPKLWSKCASLFTFESWGQNSKYPDLLGQCYNYLCEYLIESIVQSDFDTFSEIYPNLLKVTLLYQELSRLELLNIKEVYKQDAVLTVFTNPIIEFSTISGYAYLWSEILKEQRWKSVIESNLAEDVELQGDRASEFYSRWIGLANFLSNRRTAIYNRDLIQINWKQRIEHAIRKGNLLSYEYGRYGSQFLKTESKLLKAFLGATPDLVFHAEAYEIFFVMCINKYVPEGKKYVSRWEWEKDLNEDEDS